MKLKCYEVRHYQCDKCGILKKHIDMCNSKYCYDCKDGD